MSWQFYNEHKKCQIYECFTDIYLVCTDMCPYGIHISNIFGIMVAHMSVWLDIYLTTTIYIVTTTIYELVYASCAFSDIYRTFFCQIEVMVAHMSGLPTYITENGCSYVRHGTIYEPAFFLKTKKWLDIWAPTRHMSNHSAKKHAIMINGCSYVVVGAHMRCHFLFFMKKDWSYIVPWRTYEQPFSVICR